MRLKKVLLAIVLMCMSLLSACGSESPVEKYTYSHEKILSIAIEKTEVYSDKITIQFNDDAILKVEKVVSYDAMFNTIDEAAEFSINKNVLTIKSEQATNISGLTVYVDQDMYLEIRYLDSDNYAMIVYSWVSEMGMEPNGDTETYYTQEEKQRQAELLAENEAREAEIFALIEGEWESDDKILRLEIKENDGERVIEVYEEEEIQSTLPSIIPVRGIYIINEDPVCIEVLDDENWGTSYSFYLYNDCTEMQYEFLDIRLKRVIK